MYRFLYRFLASLACLAVRSGRSKDLEVDPPLHQTPLRSEAPPNRSRRSALGFWTSTFQHCVQEAADSEQTGNAKMNRPRELLAVS